MFYGKGGCTLCHNGPYFSDFNFYTIPLTQLGFGKNGFGIDYGRYNVTFNPNDLYKFRTPVLWNITQTAPYGHSGSIKEISKVIRMHFDPLSSFDLSSYSELKRHEFYKYLSKSDTIDKVNFLSKKEIKQLGEFLKLLEFKTFK